MIGIIGTGSELEKWSGWVLDWVPAGDADSDGFLVVMTVDR